MDALLGRVGEAKKRISNVMTARKGEAMVYLT